MNAGFEFLAWLDGVVGDGYFPARGDVQRAYGRGGWDAVDVRCIEAIDTCRGSSLPGVVEMLETWSTIRDAAKNEAAAVR